MHADEVNIVVLLDSPEESPATSCAAVSFSSPVCLSVARVPHVSRRAEGGSQTWATPCLGRASVCFAGRRFFGPAHQ